MTAPENTPEPWDGEFPPATEGSDPDFEVVDDVPKPKKGDEPETPANREIAALEAATSFLKEILPLLSAIKANVQELDARVERIEGRRYEVLLVNLKTGKSATLFRGTASDCFDYKEDIEPVLGIE